MRAEDIFNPKPVMENLMSERIRELEERVKALEAFELKLVQNIKSIDPEFSKTVDAHFWELT